jgi:hypothetical protein
MPSAAEKRRSFFLSFGVGSSFQLHYDKYGKPDGRIYDERRLKKLIQGFEIEKIRFFVKKNWGVWLPSSTWPKVRYPEKWAGQTKAIVCLKLRKPQK